MAKIIGIDVSSHNGTLDWEKIKTAGISFAIIRGGYGRYQVDSQCIANIKGALSQKIPVGIYWFSYALNVAAAKEEAQKCLETIRGYDVTFPIFFDFEYDTIRYAEDNGITLGKTAFNAHAVAFCETIRAAGYTPGVYYNLDYYRNMVDIEKLSGYTVWYAQYSSSPSISDFDIWQYSSSGTISGQSGRFDMNELKNTDLLDGGKYTGPTGWQEDDTGWQYVHEDGSFTKSSWELIDDKWYYFDKEGYRLENEWVFDNGNSYYLGADGVMATNRMLKIDAAGKLVPAGGYYYKLSDVDPQYRETLDQLISKGILKGREGSGENLVLDMSEDAVRLLVILNRAGVFDE